MKIHKIAPLALTVVSLTAWRLHAQAGPSSWTGQAEESVAVLAGKAVRMSALPQRLTASAAGVDAAAADDIPGVRETVRRLAINVARTCADGQPRYVLHSDGPKNGPSVSAAADSLQSDYLYPQASGLRLALDGGGPGAALSIGAAGGTMRVLGTIAAEEGACREYPDTSARLEIASSVAVALSVEPRTGIFRPACYRDPINGFYKLDTWTVLTVSFPQEALTVKTADSAPFPDKETCLEFYGRLKTGR